MLTAFNASALIASSASAFPSSTVTTFHYFTDPNFMGDKNHALGVASALRTLNMAKGMTFSEREWSTTTTSYTDFVSTLKKEQIDDSNSTAIKPVVLGIGTHGLDILSKLVTEEPLLSSKLYLVWSGHQYIANLERLAEKINLMALPFYALTPEIKAKLSSPAMMPTGIVPMTSVPHIVNRTSIEEAYKKWQENHNLQPIPLAKTYLGVILGGDAPDEANRQHYFTAEEAQIIGMHVAKTAAATGATVLCINGPRTGKYNPKTGTLNDNVHQEHEKAILDETTAAFEKVMRESRTPHAIFNFVAKKPSAYQPVLYSLISTGSMIFVTGDSTSFISEIIDISTKDQLRVVRVGSMNKTHIAHMEFVAHANKGQGLSIDPASGTLVPVHVAPRTETTSYVPAAEALANTIFDNIGIKARPAPTS